VTDPTSKAILSASGLPAAQNQRSFRSIWTAFLSLRRMLPNRNAWSARIDRNLGGGRDLLTGPLRHVQKARQNSEGNTFYTNQPVRVWSLIAKNKPQESQPGLDAFDQFAAW